MNLCLTCGKYSLGKNSVVPGKAYQMLRGKCSGKNWLGLIPYNGGLCRGKEIAWIGNMFHRKSWTQCPAYYIIELMFWYSGEKCQFFIVPNVPKAFGRAPLNTLPWAEILLGYPIILKEANFWKEKFGRNPPILKFILTNQVSIHIQGRMAALLFVKGEGSTHITSNITMAIQLTPSQRGPEPGIKIPVGREPLWLR